MQFGLMFKDQNIRFKPSNSKEGKSIESSVFEDIRITPYGLSNSLIVLAPEATMPLVLALIRDVDVLPIARSEINIFTLKRADATQMATMLQQLFVGVGASAQARRRRQAEPGAPVPPGLRARPAAPPAAAGQARAPIQMTITGFAPDGAPIIDLRVTVDDRTNSLIVAGSRNDLLTVETIIDRIENAVLPNRINDTVRLRNANAQDVANAINDFFTKVKAVYTSATQATPSLQLMRDVVVSPDPITNSLLISATPEYFEQVLRQVAKLDTMPPQVVISVLIAEVTLNGNEEFGVELGLQNPLMFTRAAIAIRCADHVFGGRFACDQQLRLRLPAPQRRRDSAQYRRHAERRVHARDHGSGRRPRVAARLGERLRLLGGQRLGQRLDSRLEGPAPHRRAEPAARS